jgi:hypothetical protein
MPFGFLAPEYFKIIWLSNILALSVHDEGHSVHDEGHSVHDEGHSRNASCGLNYKNIFSLNLRFYFYELHCHG